MSQARKFPLAIDPRTIGLRKVEIAKSMMRQGCDLHEAAKAIGVRARDLDLSLWTTLGNPGVR